MVIEFRNLEVDADIYRSYEDVCEIVIEKDVSKFGTVFLMLGKVRKKKSPVLIYKNNDLKIVSSIVDQIHEQMHQHQHDNSYVMTFHELMQIIEKSEKGANRK